MKPFDLEAAKRGKAFCRFGYPTVPLRFIGCRQNGAIVFERTEKAHTAPISEAFSFYLRMLPKKIVKYALVSECRVKHQGMISSGLHDSPESMEIPLAAGYHIARVEWEE